MKKLLISLLIAIPLLVPSALSAKKTNALTTPSPKPTSLGQSKNFNELRQIKREELRQRILERTTIRNERKEAKTQALDAKKQDIIRSYFTRMVSRMNDVIARINILIQRIESRLAVIKSEGGDTSKIQPEIDKAKTLLLEAQADLDAASGNIELILSSNDPKAAFSEIRNTIKGVKTKLVEVHKILVHTIGDIKGLRVGVGNTNESESEASASPTATATAVPSVTATPTVEPTATSTPTSTPTIEPSVTPTATP